MRRRMRLEARPEVERELPAARYLIDRAHGVEFEHQSGGGETNTGTVTAQQRTGGRLQQPLTPELPGVRKDQSLDRQRKGLQAACEDPGNRKSRFDVGDERARRGQIADVAREGAGIAIT